MKIEMMLGDSPKKYDEQIYGGCKELGICSEMFSSDCKIDRPMFYVCWKLLPFSFRGNSCTVT